MRFFEILGWSPALILQGEVLLCRHGSSSLHGGKMADRKRAAEVSGTVAFSALGLTTAPAGLPFSEHHGPASSSLTVWEWRRAHSSPHFPKSGMFVPHWVTPCSVWCSVLEADKQWSHRQHHRPSLNTDQECITPYNHFDTQVLSNVREEINKQFI